MCDETQATLCNNEDSEGDQWYGSTVSTNIYLWPLYCKAFKAKERRKERKIHTSIVSACPPAPAHSTFCLPSTQSHYYHQKLRRHSQSKSTHIDIHQPPVGWFDPHREGRVHSQSPPTLSSSLFPMVSPIFIQTRFPSTPHTPWHLLHQSPSDLVFCGIVFWLVSTLPHSCKSWYQHSLYLTVQMGMWLSLNYKYVSKPFPQ